jgi:hypothetical protein
MVKEYGADKAKICKKKSIRLLLLHDISVHLQNLPAIRQKSAEHPLGTPFYELLLEIGKEDFSQN